MPSHKKKPDKRTLRKQTAADALGEFRPKGIEQWGMFLIGMAVACYIAFVICSKIFLLLPLDSGLAVYLLFPVLAPLIYWLMCFALRCFQENPPARPSDKKKAKKKKKQETPKEAAFERLKELTPTVHSAREKLSPKVFFGAFLGVFVVLALALLAQYPGGFANTDIGWQWMQVQTGNYDAWHPPIHTFLIWLVTRVVNSYGFFIAVQALFFSLLCGYMAATLRAWGMQKLWIAFFVVAIVSTHSTRGLMLHAYKDSMFTCFALWLAVCLANIALSRGEWLGKWSNRAALAVVLAFVSTIRLNGFFFTVPVVALLFALYGKKRAVASAFSGALALLLVLGVTGPLYNAVGVKRFAGQTYEEMTVSPMNVLCSIYTVKPDALNEDGIQFMQWRATPAQWKEWGRFGDYRGIKGANNPTFPQVQEKMDQVLAEYALHCPPKKLPSMLWHVIKNEPTLALKALAHATYIMWDPTAVQHTIKAPPDHLLWVTLDHPALNEDLDNRLTGIQLRESVLAETKMPFFRVFQKFQAPFQAIEWVFHHLTPGSLLQCVGINIIALMLGMWFSLRRRRGWEALLLALPSLACSLTLLPMMIGPDYRWLHFNVVITVPLVLVCLAKSQGKKNPRNEEKT